VLVAPQFATRLFYNYDEGVYIQQARLVMQGEQPYVDFFHHQTPLYVYTLAAFAAPAADSLLAHRLLSILATATTGFFVYRIAARLLPAHFALVALALFFTAPLQYHGLLALPNALMLTFSTAAVYLVGFCQQRSAVTWGAVLLVVSVLYKPLSIATGVALVLALLLSARERWKLRRFAASGLVAGLAAWGLLHAVSGGLFTELIGLQIFRYADKSGFEIMSSYDAFHLMRLEPSGITSALGFNLDEHRRTLLRFRSTSTTAWLVTLAAAGQILVWWRAGPTWRGRRMLVTLWWLVPMAFTIFVWEPSWDHYLIQYLPPLVVLATWLLYASWSVLRGRRAARITVVGAVAAFVVFGPLKMSQLFFDYARMPYAPGETWLTFDPFLNFISRTEPACGLIDPFNVYGERSLTAGGDSGAFSKFRLEREDLLRCLAEQPKVKVGIGYWGAWFVDERVRAEFDALPPGRMAFAPRYFRPAPPTTPGGFGDEWDEVPKRRASDSVSQE
jgi:4-amino-4-deoxy-L-arabinose transferase-like glycosyltransferase